MKLVKVVELTIKPKPKPTVESIGSQTEWKIGRERTAFEDENSRVYSTH